MNDSWNFNSFDNNLSNKFRDTNDSFLNDWNLNKSLDFSDSFNFYDSVNNFFNNLWNFNNLFNNSWNDDNFFNNLFNFNDSWDLNHLFNNLINVDSDLFDSLNSSWNLNDFFNNNLDWIVLSDVMIDWLFDFNNFVDFNNSVN